MMIRLHDERARRFDGSTRESGSAMLMSVMFTVFAGGIMLVLLSVLLSQMQSIQLAQKTTRTGYTAQAGIQAALSVLRSNTQVVGIGASAKEYGDPTKLPETLTGTADGDDDSTLEYSVRIQYYTQDPTNRDDAWLSANALPHPLSADPASQPKYALIVSSGADTAVPGLDESVGDRTVTALYTFTTTNANVAGGLIRTPDAASCLMAGSATVGSTITTAPINSCTDDALNLWIYDTDYRLKLASTTVGGAALCITGQKWVPTLTGTNNSTENATLQPCAGNASAFGNQLWSWDDPGSWQGQTRGNTLRTNRWLSVNGTTVVDGTAKRSSFDPMPSVGAGAASASTSQLVNYQEFGRCLDVANNRISSGYLIAYPCKQDPTGTGAAVNWNHKWYYSEPASPDVTSAPQAIWVRENEIRPHCLAARSGSGNTQVHATPCATPTIPASLNTQQRFIRNGDTQDTLTSYTIQFAADTSLCLTAVPQPAAVGAINWSRIHLMACNGSSAQKWNAPAITDGASLGGYKEIG